MSSTRLTAATCATTGLMLALGVATTAGLDTPSHDARLSSAATRTPAQVLRAMTLRQKVGQMFMVGTPATSADPATLAQIGRFHVGSVILTGRSYAGAAAAGRVTSAMQRRTTAGATDRVRLLVATDQEGGLVQVLHGRGISEIPSALDQGRWALPVLRNRAHRWAAQLRRAGVNMDLAPVLDTVPGPRAARSNPPIGVYDREFGYLTRVVTRHGLAFTRGLRGAGVIPTVKHFPGLGRVHANTDTSTGVTDRVTTRHDAYLRPFAAAVHDGVPVVMMSTAYYARIDPKNPASFSPFVIQRMLRGDLGFRGVVVSDDLANAAQTSRWRPGVRAVKFVRAGGDLVLTVNPATLPAMFHAVFTRALHVASFRARVDQSALRILRLKARHGLLR